MNILMDFMHVSFTLTFTESLGLNDVILAPVSGKVIVIFRENQIKFSSDMVTVSKHLVLGKVIVNNHSGINCFTRSRVVLVVYLD